MTNINVKECTLLEAAVSMTGMTNSYSLEIDPYYHYLQNSFVSIFTI